MLLPGRSSRRSAVVALVPVLALALAAGGCLDEAKEVVEEEPAPAEVSFIAIGDMGTGHPDQLQVAAAVKEVCDRRGCDFALGLGDLIYPQGVASARDPQFDSKFEVPYKDLEFPFWMALGNHDNGGEFPGPADAAGGLGAWYANGNHMVAYSERTDRASDKWHMPGRYYVFSEGPADFAALDTNTMLFYGMAVPPDLSAGIQEQEAWLEDVVEGGENGGWEIAFGHHPYLSNGEHGDAGEYDGLAVPGARGDHLKSLFEQHLCDHVDLYLAGHDHNLQWLQPVASCGRTHFLVSGGGGAGLYDLPGDNTAVFQASSLGFWWLRIAGDTLTAVAFDADGEVLFEGILEKPVREGTGPGLDAGDLEEEAAPQGDDGAADGPAGNETDEP